MPRIKHRLGAQSETALRQFTDREGFLTAFDSAFAVLAPDRHSLLAFYGVGGIGKTALLQEIRRRLREQRPYVAQAQLDFRDGEGRLPAMALVRLRAAVGGGFRVPFPSFDIAFSVYWKLAHPHLPLNRSELPFLAQGEIAAEIVGTLAEVPVVGFVARIPGILHRTGRAAHEWWTRRGQAELRNIATLDDPAAVEEWLPAFWAADLRAWLADEPARRAVLFLDTYEALLQGESREERGAPHDEWVRDWAGHLPGVLLVVAGREKLRWTEEDESWEGLIEQHLVGSLAPTDAERFLQAAGVAESEVRAAIVERSEGVPLYLDLAVDTYERIREREDRTPRPEEFDRNLGKLLDRFLHYLSDAQRAALFTLSVPESFDLERFTELMRSFATGYPATRVGLEAIRRFSFVEEPEPGVYTLHALVREALAAKDDPDERARVHRYLFEQAQTALAGLEARTLSDRHRRALREGSVHGQAVLEPEAFLGWYWRAEAPFNLAAELRLLQPLREDVLAYAEQQLGPDHPGTLAAVHNLGFLQFGRGRLSEAESLYRRALEGHTRAFGAEHRETLTTLNNLAGLLHARGELEEAGALYRRALEAWERLLGPEHPLTLITMHNLGRLLHDRGKLEEAEILMRRAFEAEERALGAEHPNTLNMLDSLASLLEARGRLDEAEPLFRRALAGRERVLGPEHPETLVSANNLARLLQHRGQVEAAEPLFRRALEGTERALGPEHPHTLATVNNLAFLLQARGRLDEAAPLFQRTLHGLERVLGAEHSRTLIAVNNLAALLRQQRRLDEAEPLYRRALDGMERALGPEHPMALAVRSNLGGIFQEQGRFEEAEPLYRRVLAGLETALGPGHPETLVSVANLGTLLQARGQLEEATTLYRRALQGNERGLGADHHTTLATLSALASLLQDRGELEEAEPLYRLTIERYERVLGADHPTTLTSVNNLGLLLRDRGSLEEAAQHLRRAVEGYRDALGAEHPWTQLARANLASLPGAIEKAEDG